MSTPPDSPLGACASGEGSGKNTDAPELISVFTGDLDPTFEYYGVKSQNRELQANLLLLRSSFAICLALLRTCIVKHAVFDCCRGGCVLCFQGQTKNARLHSRQITCGAACDAENLRQLSVLKSSHKWRPILSNGKNCTLRLFRRFR